MATFACSAPVPERSALVEDPRFQDAVRASRVLIERILGAIPDAHESYVRSQALPLTSSNAELVRMARRIGFTLPLGVVSEDVLKGTCLRNMSERLQMHQALLKCVSPHLEKQDKVRALLVGIRDLILQINKMLRMSQGEALVPPTPTPVTLNLNLKFEVQVAVHLALVQLQSFGKDMVLCLNSQPQQ